MGTSPSGSVQQTTLDGRILSEEEFEEVVDEMSRVPCDKKCLLALEDECRCQCGGVNHGKWVRGAAHDSSLDVFGSEGGPMVFHDIARGKLELMLLARKEVVAAYGSLLGGLIRLPKAVMEELDVDEGDELLFFSNGGNNH